MQFSDTQLTGRNVVKLYLGGLIVVALVAAPLGDRGWLASVVFAWALFTVWFLPWPVVSWLTDGMPEWRRVGLLALSALGSLGLWLGLDAMAAKKPGALWEKSKYVATVQVLASRAEGPNYRLMATVERDGGYWVQALHMPNGGTIRFPDADGPIESASRWEWYGIAQEWRFLLNPE